MAYFLIALGAVIAYLDYLGSDHLTGAGKLLKTELFNGNPPFYKWLGAIIIVALIGYIPEMKPIATAFLILIVLSIVLSHGNEFSSLIKGL